MGDEGVDAGEIAHQVAEGEIDAELVAERLADLGEQERVKAELQVGGVTGQLLFRNAGEIGEDGAQQMGRDAQGRIWLLYEDGVLYPQEQGQRERVPFHLPAAGMPGWMALIDPDGHSPLILHLSEGFILASSAQTGQVLRAYPLNVPPSDIFALQYLAGGRFYLSTRQGLQIFDVDQALDGREVAAEYQQLLEESTAWQLRLERQPLEQPANDW